MSKSNTAERMAFFELPEKLEAEVTRSRVDAVASGYGDVRPVDIRGRGKFRSPEAAHAVHGRMPVGDDFELRVTTTFGRLWVRLWRQTPNGTWWPVRESKGVQVRANEIATFKSAVLSACAAIEDAKDGQRSATRAEPLPAQHCGNKDISADQSNDGGQSATNCTENP